MSIVFRSGLPSGDAQTHALVIGVGEYLHLPQGSKFGDAPARNSFGLAQLKSPPVSAKAFADWLPKLHNPRAPIGTVELLLSPASYFSDSAGNQLPVDLPTMANVLKAFGEWSDRSDANSHNTAIFYYCGHGLEEDSTILLPCDFGDPAHKNIALNMIDLDLTVSCNLRESKARTQLYLIDACREISFELQKLSSHPLPLISTIKDAQQWRDSIVIKATNRGMQTHATPGAISFFTSALLDCLQKMGARAKNAGRWEVTTNSLGLAMRHRLQRLKVSGNESSMCEVSGGSNFETVIHSFAGPAHVMSAIDCAPNSAIVDARFAVRKGDTIFGSRDVPSTTPYEIDIPAGEYDVAVQFAVPRYADKVCAQIMHPPFTPCTLEVDR
jgi:hypothetical protein